MFHQLSRPGDIHDMDLSGSALSIARALSILETAFRTQFNKDLFHWKLSRPGAQLHLAEHATITTLDLPIAGIDGVTTYDWASTERGAGRELYRHAIDGRTLISIGGTSDSRRAKAKLGLQVVGHMYSYTRIIRPRLVQYALDSVRTGRASWSHLKIFAEPVEEFEVDDIPGEFTQCKMPKRTVDYVNSLLECPVGAPRGYRLRDMQGQLGYGVFMQFGHRCRIVDFRVASGDQADWNAAMAALLEFAVQEPATAKIFSAATCRLMAGALTVNGFWKGARLRIYGKEGLDFSNIHLTLSDGDLFVL